METEGGIYKMRMIVAADRNWAIGKSGKLLVSIPADMKWFRQETAGKTLILGRKTLNTFPGGLPLKDRRNIVLTSGPSLDIPGTETVHSAEEALRAVEALPPDQVYCIGGAQVYREFLPYADMVHVTRIDFAYEADAWFPDLDSLPEWQITAESEEQTYFDLEYRFVRYERKS